MSVPHAVGLVLLAQYFQVYSLADFVGLERSTGLYQCLVEVAQFYNIGMLCYRGRGMEYSNPS